METFGVLVLLGLGLSAFVTLGNRFVTVAREFWAFVTVGVGVGLAWAADLNMWRLWHLTVSGAWIGITLNGLTIAGLAYFWHALLWFFRSIVHNTYDDNDNI